MIDYAATYFTQLRNERSTIDSNHNIPSEEEEEEMDALPPVKSLSFNRRKSVFAEQYDPEEEDDDEKIVYPKSDDQRRRLGEAVKNILLFRALDPQEMSEVLDAMFERKVETGDLVIRQGDDGDYFYVIEK